MITCLLHASYFVTRPADSKVGCSLKAAPQEIVGALIQYCSSLSLRLYFAQAALEKPSFTVVGDEFQCAGVGLGRLLLGAEAAQQVGAGGVQQVVAVEIAGGGEGVDEIERWPGAFDHRHGHG